MTSQVIDLRVFHSNDDSAPVMLSTVQPYLRQLLEALPVAAALVRHDGLVLLANDAMRQLLGFAAEGDQINMRLRSPAVTAAFESAWRDGTRTTCQNPVHGVPPRVIEVTCSRLQGTPDEKPMVVVCCQDITREQNVERMRSDFVANASHELRTPLTTLSGFIDTIQGAAAQDEKARNEFLKLMRTQADRMSRLIDDLLSLSKIELDEHVAPGDTVDLTSVVGQAQALLSSLAKDNGCDLVVKMPHELLVRGDAGQLGQVVYNFIENAIKYSGQGSRVTVTGELQGGMAMVSVEDNGPGIAAQHVPRLTERFYRVNVQASRTRGGTGLGLAICKHIINRHRGRLVIESAEGKGSKFAFLLPIT